MYGGVADGKMADVPTGNVLPLFVFFHSLARYLLSYISGINIACLLKMFRHLMRPFQVAAAFIAFLLHVTPSTCEIRAIFLARTGDLVKV